MSKGLSSLDLVAVFLAVMAEGSLTGAANKLKRAQPTVRRQIERLEQDLGLALFTRSPNGLIPTETAKALLASAQNVASNAAAFERAASSNADSLAGVVRVTCPRIFAAFRLPSLVADLRANNNDLEIELAADDRVENLLEREADIAIRLSEPTQLSLIAKKLAPIELGVFATPDLAAQICDRLTMDELLRFAPFIWSDTDVNLDMIASELGMPPPDNVSMRSDDQIVQIHAIQAGVGVGFCQVPIALNLGLKRLVPSWLYSLSAWAVMHEDQSQIRRVRHVFDHLVTWLGKESSA